MTVMMIPAREFARSPRRAQQAASEGPVFITNRGRPTFVLLNIDDYHRLAGQPNTSLLEVMDAIPGGDFDFEPPVLSGNGFKPAQFNE